MKDQISHYKYSVNSIANISDYSDQYEKGDKIFINNIKQIFVYKGKGIYINEDDVKAFDQKASIYNAG